MDSAYLLPLCTVLVLTIMAGALYVLLRRAERLEEKARIAELGGQNLAKEVVQRIRSEETLAELGELRAKFVSSVSHELRTPLTSIQGFARTILSDPHISSSKVREFVGIIEEESRRLSGLVEEILELSSIDSGVIKLKIEEFPVQELLHKAESNLLPLLQAKSIKLNCSAVQGVKLRADSNKLLLVLTNLLGNAAKFSLPGSTVFLRTYVRQGEIIIEVEDNGRGIPSSEQSKIFERFHRVDYPGEEIRGTGLGLAISKEIVERHKGHVEVRSEVGKGSVFCVHLPSA